MTGYSYGVTPIHKLRMQVQQLAAQLAQAAKDLDAANRSARKYKALYEKGNVETRNAAAAEMNRLLARIQQLEEDNASKDGHIRYLEATYLTSRRSPEGTKRLLEAVAEKHRPRDKKTA